MTGLGLKVPLRLVTHRNVFLLLAFVVCICSGRFLDMRNDDAYITYRYAQNLVHGAGFVFNPGEHVLATTSPFHALILSAIAVLYPNLPLAANILSGIALVALSIHTYLLLDSLGYAVAGLISALFIMLNVWTFSVFPLETVILLSLEIALFYYYFKSKFLIASILGVCAVLTRLDAIILVLMLSAHYLITMRNIRRVFVPAILFGAILVTWFSFSFLYYGTFLPNTFSAKTGFAGNLLVFLQSIWPKVISSVIGDSPYLSALPVILSFVSVWSALKESRWNLLLIPLWGALYIAGYSLLNIGFPHAWYYYPLVVVTLILGCQGGNYLYDSLRKRLAFRYIRLFDLVAALFVSFLLMVQVKTVYDYSLTHHNSPWTTARERAYVQVSDWLREHTEEHATIAAFEIGTVGYYSNRTIVDLLGLATPATIPNVRTGDWGKSVLELKPDYVVVQDRVGQVGQFVVDVPGSDKLVILQRQFSNYKPVQRFTSELYDITVYRRVDNTEPSVSP